MAAASRNAVNWDVVRADMERSIASALGYGWRPDAAITRYHYAELLRDKPDIAQAREQLYQAIKLFGEMEMTRWLEQSMKLQAELA